jgi:hypothetical protein
MIGDTALREFNIHSTPEQQMNLKTSLPNELESLRLSYSLFLLTLPEISGDATVGERQMIISVCNRPEMKPLAKSTTFKVDRNLDVLLRVPSADLIILNSKYLKHHSIAALYMRYGLELALWQRTMSDNMDLGFFIATGFLAGYTARRYWESMLHREYSFCADNLPEEFSRILKSVEKNEIEKILQRNYCCEFRSTAREMLKMQGINSVQKEDISDSVLEEASDFIEAGLFVAPPLEWLLTAGGDDRLKINRTTGLNSYGCSPRPRPWAVTFASTTASSISEYAFGETEKMRQRLIEAVCFDRTDKQYADDYKRVRLQIAEVLDVDEYEELSVILTTSGTDAELLALYFSLCASERAVMNILVGPEETGSGVVSAATGLHFSSHTPFGKTIKKGYPIEEMPTERIRIGEVPLRDEEGIEFTKEKIDGRLKILVGKAIADGCHVLIHLVNSSKTGLTAPSLETVVSLKKRHGSSVDIVVDACQSRIGKNKLRKYIAEGFMVIITGSKFYTGPPFSGALLVPSPISQRVNNSKRCLPAGFKNYFSYHEFPEGWQVGRNHLSRMKNVGLLLRWQAALWEMQTFRAVSEKQKYLIFMLFGESIRQAINSNPDLRLVDSAVNERWRLPDRAEWDWLPTIFTFMMIGSISEGRRKPLFISETKKIYHWLNDSISHLLPSEA